MAYLFQRVTAKETMAQLDIVAVAAKNTGEKNEMVMGAV